MNILIGDIGNTITKLCLVDIKNLKLKKVFYLNSKKILLKNLLKKKLNEVISNKSINKIALFSSVVPKYCFALKRILKKNYKIQLKEIKEKNINKIVKMNLKNKNQVGSDRIANAVGVYRAYKSNCRKKAFGKPWA